MTRHHSDHVDIPLFQISILLNRLQLHTLEIEKTDSYGSVFGPVAHFIGSEEIRGRAYIHTRL